MQEPRKRIIPILLSAAIIVFGGVATVFTQSSDANFPTPVTSNEVTGVIPARDVGDSRLTTHYYVFNGNRGDVFINIITRNFKGTIDVYTAKGLDPRTKITVYADNPDRETGRVVYQRRPEKLILRVQGRTPNSDPATYQLKFAGSFAPITGAEARNTNEFPDIASGSEGSVRVNSVGAIIESEKPKEAPQKAVVLPEAADRETPADDVRAAAVNETPDKESTADRSESVNTPENESGDSTRPELPAKPRVIITDELPKETPSREVTVDMTGGEQKPEVSAVVRIEKVTEEPDLEKDKTDETRPANISEKPSTVSKNKAEEANPLARVFLKVEMKDGSRFEMKMTEVKSVNVVNGMLTIVTAEGKTREIPILSVLKMTIE